MKRSQANLLMLLVAAVWAATFVAQMRAMAHIGPMAFTGIRFLVGAAVVAPVAWLEWRQPPAVGPRTTRMDALCIVGLGLALALGAGWQQIGLLDTSVTHAGVLTALYVPMVALLGCFLGTGRPHALVWVGALGAVLGAFLLSGAHVGEVRGGDWWVLASVLPWTLHVLWVGAVAHRTRAPFTVACAQFVVCGVLSLVWAIPTEPISWAAVQAAAGPILFAGVLSVGLGFTGQVVAQRHTHPADAAVTLSSETLFTALLGQWLMGDRLSEVAWVGAGVLFASTVIVQVGPLIVVRSRAWLRAALWPYSKTRLPPLLQRVRLVAFDEELLDRVQVDAFVAAGSARLCDRGIEAVGNASRLPRHVS